MLFWRDGATEITYTQRLAQRLAPLPNSDDDDDDSEAKNPRQLNACKQTDVSSEVEGAEIGQCRGHMSHNIDGFTPHGGELWLWGFDLRFGRQVYNIILEVIWLSILSMGTGYSQD